MNLQTIRTIFQERMKKLRKKPDSYQTLFKPMQHWQRIVTTSVIIMIFSVVVAGTAFFFYGNLSLSVRTESSQPLLDKQDLEEVLLEYLEKEAQFQQLQNDPPEFIEP